VRRGGGGRNEEHLPQAVPQQHRRQAAEQALRGAPRKIRTKITKNWQRWERNLGHKPSVEEIIAHSLHLTEVTKGGHMGAADWTPADAERHLFLEIADTYDEIVEDAVAALAGDEDAEEGFEDVAALRLLAGRLDAEGTDALKRLLEEGLQRFAHSFFAVLDGAAADSEEEVVKAVDALGRELDGGLHERWVSFLFDTGRAS
jgi:hypothetical protein